VKVGDLVILAGSYRCSLVTNKPAIGYAWDDMGRSGEVHHRELCVVLELDSMASWLKVLSSRTGAVGWIEAELMDEVY
jgi:hypothetical protein